MLYKNGLMLGQDYSGAPSHEMSKFDLFCNISITIMFITFIFGIPMIHHCIHIDLDQNIWPWKTINVLRLPIITFINTYYESNTKIWNL